MSRTVYCTIASANYLPQVMVVVDSLRANRPGADVRILLCEHPAVVRELSAELKMPFVAVDQIGCDNWLQMAFLYDVTEFNTSVKPFLIRTLLKEGADQVVYFDPDIQIFSDLEPLEKLAAAHDCVLTPHCLKPLPEDGLIPRMVDVNRCGQFNLGFGAFRASPVVDSVLKWWGERLELDCISDPPNGLFTDQAWANLFTSFIPDVKILRSTAYNMAYWNYPLVKLWRQDGRWMTEDGPLVFFHFSGVTKDDLPRVSRHQNRTRAPEGSPLHTIMSEYVRAVRASPLSTLATLPYSFSRYADGSDVPMWARRRFRALTEVERKTLANPFTLRGYFESMQELAHDQNRELEELRAEVARLRGIEAGPMGALRYRLADRINDAIKRFPGVHQVTKRVIDSGGGK